MGPAGFEPPAPATVDSAKVMRSDRAVDQVFSQFAGFIDREMVRSVAHLGVVAPPVPQDDDPLGNLIRDWAYKLVVRIRSTAGGSGLTSGDKAGVRIDVDPAAEGPAMPEMRLPRQRRSSFTLPDGPTGALDDSPAADVIETE